MSEDVYVRLQEFLDKLPGSFPKTPNGIEINILKKFYTPEEAELVLNLKFEPEDVPLIAERMGMEESVAAERLEDLAKQGGIYRVREGDKVKYQAYQFLVGIYEFHLDSIDRELCELMEEYSLYIGMNYLKNKTKQLRVIPVDSAVEALHEVATYDRARDMVKKQKKIAVSQCICRKSQGLMDQPCSKPQEVCLSFGDFAQFGIDNGTGREISVDEAMKVLDVAEEAALVLSPSNSQEIEWICCCCSCCCGILRGMKMMPKPVEFVVSSYQARIDPDLCSACAACMERCEMEAIKEMDEVMEINRDRCIGCGNCVPACPEEAITMALKPDVETPPRDFNETLARIGKERGVM